MIWQSDYILILNGNESTDPEATGDEIFLAIAGVTPKVRLFGEVQKGGDGSLFGRVDKYIELKVFPKPFTVLAGVDDRMMSFGSAWDLVYNVLAHTYVHVRGAYSTLSAGASYGTSDLPRARISTPGSDPTYDDNFWASMLPMVCVLDGEATISENFDNGTNEVPAFTLVKSTME